MSMTISRIEAPPDDYRNSTITFYREATGESFTMDFERICRIIDNHLWLGKMAGSPLAESDQHEGEVEKKRPTPADLDRLIDFLRRA